MQLVEYMLFAEYFQFYIQDGETDDTLPVHWEPENEEDMALVIDHVIAVRTVRDLDVSVTVEVADDEPAEEDLDDWDHVIECSLQVPSGHVLLATTSEDLYDAKRLPVEPGTYSVRIYYTGLDQVDSEGFEGEDQYKVTLWKPGKDEEPAVFRILKQWEPAGAL